LVVAGRVALAAVGVVVRLRLGDGLRVRADGLRVAGHRVPAVAGIDLVVAGLVVVVRTLVAGMVILLGQGELARYRLGATGDEVGAATRVDGVVAGVVVIAGLGIVLAERLGDLARDGLGVARDLVPEAAVDVDVVVASRRAAAGRQVVGVGLGLV